jgi:hypothetical protein
MPKITLMPQGINAAFAGVNSYPERRGVIRGLSAGAARRQQQTLMSTDISQLYGAPVSFTLTVRDVPPTAEDWDKAKRALWMRFRRYGVVRVHWCLEWTRRGRPHLHGLAFLGTHKGQPGRWVHEKYLGTYWECFTPHVLVQWWSEVAGCWGVSPKGQHVSVRETTEAAWLRYMAKHASRGVGHYQRQAEAVPEGWRTTGRMWGTFGAPWPILAEKRDVPTWVFHRFRRQVRALARSRAKLHIQKGKAHGNAVQIRQGKATLRYLSRLSRISDPRKSASFYFKEWVPIEIADEMLCGIYGNYRPPVQPHRLDIKEARLRDDAWTPDKPDEDFPPAPPDPKWGDLPY